jgi:hypothetical protein
MARDDFSGRDRSLHRHSGWRSLVVSRYPWHTSAMGMPTTRTGEAFIKQAGHRDGSHRTMVVPAQFGREVSGIRAIITPFISIN